MAGKPYILAETNWKDVSTRDYEVAILPWGAMEAHNYHLPYGTDNIQAASVAVSAASHAWEAGARCIVLPTIPIGVNAQHREIKLTLNLNPSTQMAILADTIACLEDAGIQRLVIINGHGGNDFKTLIRELEPTTEIFLCCINWWTVLPPKDYFKEPGDHAGEMETSLLQFLVPDLVLPLDQAGDGAERQFKIDGLRQRWAWTPRAWHEISRDTGVGDPGAATAEKGQAFFEAATERIGEFLAELAKSDPDDLYESE
jgi:creatinine amidohydrolase